jgi:lipopolysaccharide transport system ATP-binding protein/teichoic acid transport system ATP-binding protein
MTEQPVIVVNNLSKYYKLYSSRKARLIEWLHPFGKKFHKPHGALRSVSFAVNKGDIIGIIGENGSGKSTLLKILANVASPTSGSFSVNGKITALLELGGGFNQELTGIENIYFLGAIQGYSRKEMESRMKAILDFADIGDYAGQPVNTYSSGMYVRLAFSLAINIDPDILITDEALSVGDLRFQQKCFRRIREFKEAGKTILICTHSMAVVRDFCSKAIWLHKGKIREMGEPQHITDLYSTYMSSKTEVKLTKRNTFSGYHADKNFQPDSADMPPILSKVKWQDISHCESYGDGNLHIQYAALVDASKIENVSVLEGGEDIAIVLFVTTRNEIRKANPEMTLNGQYGSTILKFSGVAYDQPVRLFTDRINIVAFHFHLPHLANGRYTISLGMQPVRKDETKGHHWVHDALVLEILNPSQVYRTGALAAVPKVTIARV